MCGLYELEINKHLIFLKWIDSIKVFSSDVMAKHWQTIGNIKLYFYRQV
jgi:hypothetical protein